MYAVQFLAASTNLVLTAEALDATLCLSFLKLCISCDVQGDNVAQIVLFSIDHDAWARVAACLLLLQVLRVDKCEADCPEGPVAHQPCSSCHAYGTHMQQPAPAFYGN